MLFNYILKQSEKISPAFSLLSNHDHFGSSDMLPCWTRSRPPCTLAGLARDHRTSPAGLRITVSKSPLSDLIHLGDSRDDHHFLWEGFSTGNVSTLFVSVNHRYPWSNQGLVLAVAGALHSKGTSEELVGEDQARSSGIVPGRGE